MNVVGSSGWLEYFARGKNAVFFAPVIQQVDSLVVPTVCMYEVFKHLLIQRGEEAALQATGVMSLGVIADLTREIAVSAAAMSYELKIAMADSIILATTRAYGATLWTQDADFEGFGDVRYSAKMK
jgi:toxin FitB